MAYRTHFRRFCGRANCELGLISSSFRYKMTKVIKHMPHFLQTITSEDYSWSDKFQLVLQVARKVQVTSVYICTGKF